MNRDLYSSSDRLILMKWNEGSPINCLARKKPEKLCLLTIVFNFSRWCQWISISKNFLFTATHVSISENLSSATPTFSFDCDANTRQSNNSIARIRWKSAADGSHAVCNRDFNIKWFFSVSLPFSPPPLLRIQSIYRKKIILFALPIVFLSSKTLCVHGAIKAELIRVLCVY